MAIIEVDLQNTCGGVDATTMMVRLGIKNLLDHKLLTLVMAGVIGISLMSFFTLQAYRSGFTARYSKISPNYLVVQMSGSFGEYYGSRIPVEVGDELLAAGVSRVIPEIHTVVGTTEENAILLRGIPMDNPYQVENYQMVSGRPLEPGDLPRLAMVGIRLGEKLSLSAGGMISIRDRDFKVVGIFENGTYADNEAWISITDAQSLLGWGTDVSVFIIPSGEVFQQGDTLPGGISIVQKGESGSTLIKEWNPFLNIITMVVWFLGIAAIIALASILWRLAWLKRRELAIIRSVGYGKINMMVYLLSQGIGISLLGFLAGVLGAMLLGLFTEVKTAGISFHAIYDIRVFLSSFVFSILLTAAGAVVPAWRLTRLNLAMLLRSE